MPIVVDALVILFHVFSTKNEAFIIPGEISLFV